jgi:DNA-binding XRE family transcriptional regulator
MVKLSQLATTEQVLAEALQEPGFRQEWDRTAFARAVAERLVVYRAEHELTQTQLARQAGTVQSVVARLERGDQAPSLATLARLSQRLGIEFHIQITPGHVGLSA